MELFLAVVILIAKLLYDRGAEISAAEKAREIAEERKAKRG
ncbi:MAG: hypothetical protein PHP02_04635 [Eubacteriales bacterium]|nr:hypothetical protein [Eubacteriales bacterium]